MKKTHLCLGLILSLHFGSLLSGGLPAFARKSASLPMETAGAAIDAKQSLAWTVPPPNSDRPEDWLARVRQAASEGDRFTAHAVQLSRQEAQARQEEYSRIITETQTKLSGMGDSAIPVLIPGLTDPLHGIRDCCIYALASFGKNSASPLIKCLSGNRLQYQSVVTVFAKAGAPATEVVVDHLKNGDAHDKAVSAQLLADMVTGDQPKYKTRRKKLSEGTTTKLLPDSAQAVILAALNEASDASVKCNLLKALTYFGAEDPKLRDKFCQVLTTDSDARVRKEAANSLGLVVVDESTEWAAASLQALAKALKSDSDSEVRIAAVQGIKAANLKAITLAPNLQAATHDHIDAVRQAALQALCVLAPENPKLFADVLTALGESDMNTVHTALFALSRMGPEAKDALPQVLDYARTNRGNTRWRAIIVLKSMGPGVAPQAVPILVELLRQNDRFGKRDVIEALGAMGSDAKAAVPVLQELQRNNPDSMTNRAIEEALKNIGTP